MDLADRFPTITLRAAPLAPMTHLRIGGPAEYLVTPRTRTELSEVVAHCTREKIPLRVLGVGTNLLVRDVGVPGAVLLLNAPEFTAIRVSGTVVRAGGGTTLASLIAKCAEEGLAGLETLVGITATIGGALRCNAGDRAGEMSDHVRSAELMDETGQVVVRERAEIGFGEHSSDLEEPVVLSVEFTLETDQPEAIVKRLRRAWIQRHARNPLTSTAAVRMFKDPRGRTAAELIEQAGLAGTKKGKAELSDRNGNYVLANPGATAGDVLSLLDTVKGRVREATGIDMERELVIW